MKLIVFTLILFINCYACIAQLSPFEQGNGNTTATYAQCINYYKQLAKQYKGIKVQEAGNTDAGKPLHLVVLSADGEYNPTIWRKQKRCVLLVNNGIHPGEPDGIDASMIWCHEILERIKAGTWSNKIAIAIIPIYNIGGALQRSTFNRVDQNGPEEFGTRGNSCNYDLNRDFIKCDTKEAESFAQIFQQVQPHVFIDNHVSDGANYPYTMSFATTQHNKLGGVQAQYLTQKLEPALFAAMADSSWPMIPYVNVWGKDARQGWTQFFDSPRYSSGYATLWHTLAFVPELHMLKPYRQRVAACKALMHCFANYTILHANEIVTLKQQAITNMLRQQKFTLAWQVNKDTAQQLNYNGYEYTTLTSKVSGLPVPHYDTTKPYAQQVPFYNTYSPSVQAMAPVAYIIPQAWHKVISLLKLNGVQLYTLPSDTTLQVEQYTITNYKCSDKPYEGHHANTQVQVSSSYVTKQLAQGDYYIPCQQLAKRFIIETLEPHAMDSYFSWNLFDAILTQKEGFTDYAFEPIAAAYLALHPELQVSLQQMQASDTAFAKDANAQLDYIHKHSPYYEKAHNVYPVFRLTPNKAANIKAQQSNFNNKSDE
jgi:hypothetical protein